MSFLRKILVPIACLVFLGFVFSTVEWHQDHDGASNSQDTECCVQCCPSHHLPPLAGMPDEIALRTPLSNYHFPDRFHYQNPDLPDIDRPPIG